MGFWIGVAVVAAVLFALAWRRRRGRPLRRLTMNEDYERAKGQAYLQAQHTRDNIGSPFHN